MSFMNMTQNRNYNAQLTSFIGNVFMATHRKTQTIIIQIQ